MPPPDAQELILVHGVGSIPGDYQRMSCGELRWTSCSPVLTVSGGLHRRNCAEPHGAPPAQRIWTRQRRFFGRQTGRPSNDRLARHTLTTAYTARMTCPRATRKASARFGAFWLEQLWARYCGCRFSGSSYRSERRVWRPSPLSPQADLQPPLNPWYSGSFLAMNSRDWLTARNSTISETRRRK